MIQYFNNVYARMCEILPDASVSLKPRHAVRSERAVEVPLDTGPRLAKGNAGQVEGWAHTCDGLFAPRVHTYSEKG